MQGAAYQILSLSQLRKSHRSILGKVEQVGARYIITDADAIVGELGPVSDSVTPSVTGADPAWAPAEGHSSPSSSD